VAVPVVVAAVMGTAATCLPARSTPSMVMMFFTAVRGIGIAGLV
jgi:hypothetical protein